MGIFSWNKNDDAVFSICFRTFLRLPNCNLFFVWYKRQMHFFCNFFIWFWDNKDILAQITGWNESPHKTQYTNWTHRRTLFGILKHRRLVFTISTKYIGILWYLRLVNRVLIGDQSHFITPLLKNSLREIKPVRKSIPELRPRKISDYLVIHFMISWSLKTHFKLWK